MTLKNVRLGVDSEGGLAAIESHEVNGKLESRTVPIKKGITNYILGLGEFIEDGGKNHE
jgi:hypothetical protein